jgi:DNA-binding transcriptional LysR family regulator
LTAGFASGRDISPVMQLGSIEAIKRMVRAGLGYSIVPHGGGAS